MKIEQLHLIEGINDVGIFKAVIFTGLPGSGKSFISKKLSGAIQPRVVNTDVMYEHLASKLDVKADSAAWDLLSGKTKQLTKSAFLNYLNGMLPLFVDGTSANAPNMLRRIGMLESFGYDVGMVWIDTDVDLAVERAASRDREVGEDFIRAVNDKLEKNKAFYRSKFGKNFTIIKNNTGELTDDVLNQAYKKVQGFFTAPVVNPVGREMIENMEAGGAKYMIPTMYEKDEISRILDVWYKK